MKTTFKCISMFLIITIILGSFGGISVLAFDNGTNPFDGGDGSDENPYVISTAQQLAFLAERTNAGDTNYNDKSYILANDIDLSAYSTGEGWMPIGLLSENKSFKGNFDGNGKKITGLYCNNPQTYLGPTCIGLFGKVTNANIHDVHIVDAYVRGREWVGGLVGNGSANITNCSVTGEIDGGNYTGGLIGSFNGGTIENCYTDVDVSSSYGAGGIAGDLFDYSNIYNCYSLGTVDGEDCVGGISGGFYGTGDELWDFSESIPEYMPSIKNCVALNESLMSSDMHTGRVVGNDSGVLSGNYAYDDMLCANSYYPIDAHDTTNGADVTMETALTANFWANTMGWDIDVWNIEDGKLPTLLKEKIANPFDGGDGTDENPYVISTAQQLAFLAERTNIGDTDYNDKSYILANDIDLSGYKSGDGWTPIGIAVYDEDAVYPSVWDLYVQPTKNPFEGSFDGNGHMITNLYSKTGGLFDYVWGATIKNVKVVDADITGSGNGAVVGIAYLSDIQNCFSSGSITGDVTIGGVAGRIGFGSKISRCFSSCTVTSTADMSCAGGVAGEVRDSSRIENCYATGNVTGEGSYVGGVVGMLSDATFKIPEGYPKVEGGMINCYATGDVTGHHAVGGVSGNASIYSVTNCVALNTKIEYSYTKDLFGRVVGYFDTYGEDDCILSGNYGLADENVEWMNKGTDQIDGADVTMETALTADYWTETMGWDTSVWNIEDGKLPTLKLEPELMTVTAKAVRVDDKIVLTADSEEAVPGDSMVLAMLYDSDDMLVACIKVPLLSDEQLSHFYVVFNDSKEADYAKVFIWDKNLSPLSIADIVDIEDYK